MSRRNNLFDVLMLPALAAGALILSACSPTGDDNAPPVAVDDQIRIDNGASIDIPAADLLRNDSDPDGDTLKLVGVSPPLHGTLTPLSGGGYRYTNDGSNSSSDRFEYRIEDGNGGKATGRVIIDITRGPTANDDRRETDEDTAVVIDVAANDTSNTGSAITISASDSGITITASPSHGRVSVTSSGEVEYTPENDFHGEDSFSYIITVNGIPSNPATVTITVRPVNDPPQAEDDTVTTPEETPVTIDVLANDSDVDDGIDSSSIEIVSSPNHGIATVNNGKITYHPAVDFFGTDRLTYRVSDGEGLQSNIASVSITVTSVNDPPVAVDDTADTGKNRPVTIDILANDSDPEGNQSIDIVQIVSQPGSGSVTVNSDKTVRYTPPSSFSGTTSFTYRLRDDAGGWSNTARVTVQVINTPPTAVGSCSTTRQENALSGTLGGSDADPGDDLTFRLGTNGTFGNGPMTTANGGTVRLTDPGSGAYIYTPKQGTGGRGRDSFTYQVVDGDGATASATETIIVAQKIMAVGDSITSGQTDVGNGGVPAIPLRTGYRKPLQQRLTSNGYSFDFVGGLDHGCNAGYDADAEGWPGYTAQQILDGGGALIPQCDGQNAPAYTGIFDALNDNPADIVLLHIGTNDLAGTDAGDVASILDDIDLWEQQTNHPVTVVLAQIIDWWKTGCSGTLAQCGNPHVQTFNDGLRTMVQGRINNGDDIILVNQHDALDYPADMGDQSTTQTYRLHPVDSGYEKMADVWLYPLIQQGDDRVVLSSANGPLLDKCE